MTIKRMRQRLDRIAPTSKDGRTYDPALAALWSNAAAHRLFCELLPQDRPLSVEEQREIATLRAAQKAWSAKHYGNEGESSPNRWDWLKKYGSIVRGRSGR